MSARFWPAIRRSASRGAAGSGADGNALEIFDGFGAEEFAADFVMRRRLLFDQRDFESGSSESKSQHRASRAASNDEMIDEALHQ